MYLKAFSWELAVVMFNLENKELTDWHRFRRLGISAGGDAQISIRLQTRELIVGAMIDLVKAINFPGIVDWFAENSADARAISTGVRIEILLDILPGRIICGRRYDTRGQQSHDEERNWNHQRPTWITANRR